MYSLFLIVECFKILEIELKNFFEDFGLFLIGDFCKLMFFISEYSQFLKMESLSFYRIDEDGENIQIEDMEFMFLVFNFKFVFVENDSILMNLVQDGEV